MTLVLISKKYHLFEIENAKLAKRTTVSQINHNLTFMFFLTCVVCTYYLKLHQTKDK